MQQHLGSSDNEYTADDVYLLHATDDDCRIVAHGAESVDQATEARRVLNLEPIVHREIGVVERIGDASANRVDVARVEPRLAVGNLRVQRVAHSNWRRGYAIIRQVVRAVFFEKLKGIACLCAVGSRAGQLRLALLERALDLL
jgi:hypothetical protein